MVLVNDYLLILTELSPSTSDPTLFPLILQAYHKGIIHLLAQTSYPTVSQKELVVFKKEFRPFAFILISAAARDQ